MSERICVECCHLEKTEHFSSQCEYCSGTVSTSHTACNHFSKRYGICPECGSYLFSYEHTEDNDWRLCTCERCGCSGTPEEFLYNSVFARITASPEVLAKFLVFHNRIYKGRTKYHSAVVGGEFDSYEEAFDATLARLKEVANG